ncbi:MAG TPA: 6-phosphofructokinase, partial [Gemmatimonadaceae bacterium]
EGAYSKNELAGHSNETMEHRAIRAGSVVERLTEEIHRGTGKEVRSLVLGHLQRGGMPTGYDRLLATRFGAAAITAIEQEKWGEMVALQSPNLVTIPIEEVISQVKRVDANHDIVKAARSTGISLGD